MQEIKAVKPKPHYAFTILIGCCFLQAGGLGAVLNSAGVFFVPVCNDLGFSRAEFSSYLSAYFIATLIFMPIAGKLLSTLNLRVLMSVCAVILAGAVGMMSVYTEMWQWRVSGALFGAAGAFIFILPAASMIGNWFTVKRGIAYGFVTAFSGVGAAVFAPLFNIFIQNFGWRQAYLIVGIIVAVMILPWTLFVFRLKPEDMGLTPYGDKQEGSRPFTRKGVSSKNALKSISFIALFLFAGFITLIHGFEVHIPGFAESIGLTAAFGATLVSAVATGSILDKLLMGYLNDKLGVQFTTFVQFGVVIFGFVGFIFSQNPVILFISAVCFGVQDSLMSVSVPLLIREIFGSKNYTFIHSCIRVGVGIFGSSSAVVVGFIYDNTGGFIPALWCGIVICAIGALLIAVAYRSRKKLVWEQE